MYSINHPSIFFPIRQNISWNAIRMRVFALWSHVHNASLSLLIIRNAMKKAWSTSLHVSIFFQGERSRVFGIVNPDGHFQGQIQTEDVTYFVEPSSLYFKQPQDFHSIIYTNDDVNFNTSSFCNADGIRQSVMNKIPLDDRHEESDQWKHRYSFDANIPEHRRKRAIVPAKTVCTLYMQADHTFYQKYGSNVDTVVAQLGTYVQAANDIFRPIGKN